MNPIGKTNPCDAQRRQVWRRGRQFPARAWRLLALAVLIPASALAGGTGDYQSTASLQAAARSFLQQQAPADPGNSMEIHLGRLDSRLRLQRCEKELQAFLPAGSRLQGKLTVGVQCTGDKPWTVYIPANIRLFGEVLTTARPISRGESLGRADVVPMRQEISKLRRGYYQRPEDVIGMLAARSLPAGTPLSPRMLKARLMVRRGDEVTIVADTGSLQVRSKGKALQDAARGERIPVRNSRSKRIVEGIATKPGTVQVTM